jgi:hypothetical protein
MSAIPTPWAGLVALAAMFLLPLLPDWLFEGARTSKHWLGRHSCGDCGAPWTDEHIRTPGRTRPAGSFVASCAGFPRLFTAPGRQPTREARSGLAAWCSFSAPGRTQPIGIAAPLGRSCEVVSRAGGAARALPGHQGEAS